MLKHACYKSKEKEFSVDVWSQHPHYRKQTLFQVNAMQDKKVMIIRNIQKTFFLKQYKKKVKCNERGVRE